MTDTSPASAAGAVEAGDRAARYDGIITYDSLVTMIIENKPRSGSVWFEQLNPSRHNLSEETKIYGNPAILEWKEIIRQLNHILNIYSLSGYEKLMTEDFLSFVDEQPATFRAANKRPELAGITRLTRLSFLLVHINTVDIVSYRCMNPGL